MKSKKGFIIGGAVGLVLLAAIGSVALSSLRKPAAPAYLTEAVSVAEDELPLFWACGVTPQAVVAATKPPFCITHAPGCMLVTDLLNSRLAVF